LEIQEQFGSFNSHVQGNKVYLNFRVIAKNNGESNYRFAFNIIADEINITSQVSSIYHVFQAIFTPSWTDPSFFMALFTCHQQNYWYSLSPIPSTHRYMNVNVVLTLTSNFYKTPQPNAANTWRRTK
jgi:hypothetical protein